MDGWVGPKFELDYLEEINPLSLPGIEHQIVCTIVSQTGLLEGVSGVPRNENV
jgi:hypothetical protein